MKQQGFTLIELVVVIVVLGILAAVAVPRFISVQTEARVAVMQGVAASISSAANMAHAKALATNQAGATGSITTEDGKAISLVFGYPTLAGMALALQNVGTNIDGTTTPGTWTYIGYAGCVVTYAQPTGAAAGPGIDGTAATSANCGG